MQQAQLTEKTLTVAEICQRNDLSVAKAEISLASLQQKGLVTGFVPGDLHAKITITENAASYFS